MCHGVHDERAVRVLLAPVFFEFLDVVCVDFELVFHGNERR